MAGLLQDLRYAFRSLRNHPGFAVTAVLTMALGIAANSTVFSWIDAVLLHPIPGASDTGRLAAIQQVSGSGDTVGLANPDFRDLQRNLRLVSGVAASHFSSFAIGPPENMQRIWGQIVSANFFTVLGVQPAKGRVFSPAEDVDSDGAVPLAVISHRLWRTWFQSDPHVLGKSVRLAGRELTVIGVLPPEFQGTFTGLALDVWVPLSMVQKLGAVAKWPAANRGSAHLEVLVRLRPGVTMRQAASEVEEFGRQLAAQYPDTHRGMRAQLLPYWRSQIGGTILRRPLGILLAVGILVLLIACANVTNLVLARAVSRRREFGIRLALGGAWRRLARQILTEVLILAGAAAVVGISLTLWTADALAHLLPATEFPIVLNFDVNLRVLAFTIALCAVTAVLSAIVPALYCARTDLNESLKEGGRSSTAGAGSHRARSLLVIAEVALAAVAVMGATLFARSFQNARDLHPGFDGRNVLLAHFYLSSAGYSGEDEKRFCRLLRERLEAAPGVTGVSYATWAPLGFVTAPNDNMQIEGYAQRPDEDLKISEATVSPGFFRLLRIPLVSGRDFTDGDDNESPKVLLVNEAFARRYFGGGEPLGRRIKLIGLTRTVVGVVKDSKYRSASENPQPMVFLPYRQAFLTGWNTYVFVRTAGTPINWLPMLRREVASLNPAASLFDAMPLTDYMEASLYAHRVAASLLGALGLLSLVLAAVGLYSVMAYTVSERTQEIGIRMAMGAHQADVLALVLRRGMLLAGAGLAAGVVSAVAAAPFLAGMLTGVSATDPVTIGGAALFLACVAALASLIPAIRATRVDPMLTLRSD